MKKYFTVFTTIVLFISLLVLNTKAQTLQLKRTVFGSGGMVGISNSANMKISGLTGQLIIGSVTNSTPGSTNYYLNQGFWVPKPVISTNVIDPQITFNKNIYNYPNPAATNTTFEFNLSLESIITLKVYNIEGKVVKIILDGFQNSGTHKIDWNTKGDNGMDLAAGSYIYELQITSADMIGTDTFKSLAFRNVLIIVR